MTACRLLILLLLWIPGIVIALEPIHIPEIDDLPWCSDSRLLQSPINLEQSPSYDTHFLSSIRVKQNVQITAISSTEDYIALSDAGHSLDLFHVTDGMLKHHRHIDFQETIDSIQFVPGQAYLLIVSNAGSSLTLLNVVTGLKRLTPQIPESPLVRVAFDTSGTFFASMHRDGTLSLYNLNHRKTVFTTNITTAPIDFFAFLDEKAAIILSDSLGNTSILDWSAGTVKQTSFQSPGALQAFDKASNGDLILSIVNQGLYRLCHHTYAVTPLSLASETTLQESLFHTSEQRAVVETDDGSLIVYNTSTGHPLFTGGHMNPVQAYDLDARGSSLISFAHDGMLSLWDVKEGTLVDTFRLQSSPYGQTYMIGKRQALLIRAIDSSKQGTRIDLIQWKWS